MRKGKRLLQKELNESLTIPECALSIILDTKNPEYYMLRAVESIKTAVHLLGNGDVYRELDKAILLLAITKSELKRMHDDAIKNL